MDRRQQGATAESVAREFLAQQGLTLVCENYRCRGGELDLVMLDGRTLVIVEVRQRANERYGSASESVDWRKRRRLVYATRHLLMRRPALSRHPARFDVITLTGDATAGAV